MGWVVAAVHEDVLAATMTVEVAEQTELTLLSELKHHLLTRVDGRMEDFRWGFPTAVEVAAGQRAAVVTVNHAIRVQHWYNLKHKVLPQQLGCRLLGTS